MDVWGVSSKPVLRLFRLSLATFPRERNSGPGGISFPSGNLKQGCFILAGRHPGHGPYVGIAHLSLTRGRTDAGQIHRFIDFNQPRGYI